MPLAPSGAPMKTGLCCALATAFLATSSLALADQTMPAIARVEHAVAGAALAGGGFSLHGTVMHAGAPWALRLLASAGLGATASTLLVASVGSVATGLGIYQLTRAIVGADPSSAWRMGLPGFVSGGILTAIGGEGIVQIGLAMAAGTAGLGLAMAATSIIAVAGVGFLAYGGWLAWNARRTHAGARIDAGTNVPRQVVTRPQPAAAPTSVTTANAGFHR